MTMILLGMIVILLVSAIKSIHKRIKMNRLLKEKDKDKDKRDIEYINKELNENKWAIIAYIGFMIMIIIMIVTAINLKYDRVIIDSNLKLEIDQKIEDGYKVYVKYNNKQDKTIIEDYVYNIGDNIEVNDENREIYLEIDRIN